MEEKMSDSFCAWHCIYFVMNLSGSLSSKGSVQDTEASGLYTQILYNLHVSNPFVFLWTPVTVMAPDWLEHWKDLNLVLLNQKRRLVQLVAQQERNIGFAHMPTPANTEAIQIAACADRAEHTLTMVSVSSLPKPGIKCTRKLWGPFPVHPMQWDCQPAVMWDSRRWLQIQHPLQRNGTRECWP